MNFSVYDGKPILGATVDNNSTNFAIFSRNATRAILQIFTHRDDTEPVFEYELDKKRNKTGDIWHIKISDVGHGTYYGWRLDGPYNLLAGNRFNINKLLIDPYSKAVAREPSTDDESIFGFYQKDDGDTSRMSLEDSVAATYKSVVIDDGFYDWEDDMAPNIPREDTIIYELHVGMFTNSPTSGVMCKGSFKGILEKINHLKELGVTAIELLPIHEFNRNSNINYNPLTGERLKDIWGYNTNNFFAVSRYYADVSNDGDEVFYFKDFVKAVHKAGLEVILDVVYNHTGEGNEHGPTLCFRGIDNQIYYMLKQENKSYYANYSGTGNTVNCNHRVVKQMILDSLRYWVTEMHVDGFRFDLASILGRDTTGQWIGEYSVLRDIAQDPILSRCKLIAESWDAAGGYHVGEMPVGFAEWNGVYRDTIRKFIKGDLGTISGLATRITGSFDLYNKVGRGPLDSVNFVTAHDGFTMWDLVSYNNKHNMANGENNRDGSDNNESYNHGVEGETDNPEIIAIRKQQVKNMITLLMVSQGTPMILMGDEFCRTQKGNNNTYCQDNDISWVDWSRKEEFNDVYRYFCKIINFRQTNPVIKRGKFVTHGAYPDITWHGIKPDYPDWSYYSRTIAFVLHADKQFGFGVDKDVYVAINGYEKPLGFVLPKLQDHTWNRIVDTAKKSPEDFLDVPVAIGSEEYTLQPFSILICISEKVR